MVPVAIFAALVASLTIRSWSALDRPGLGELFSSRFASQFTTGEGIYGLLPSMSGTVFVTVIAIGLALPVSLSLAVLSSEFTLGFVGKAMRPLMGLFAGIPAIVYALLAIVFVERFMIPKFAADSTFGTFDPAKIGADPGNWPPSDVPWSAGAFPWDLTGLNNSTLLGGILISLLVIPFMAPLIDDAIRNVPNGQKEASLALGANRWYTLKRIVLPLSSPGLVSAMTLGSLKALGDTMIVVFVVGFEANSVPDPAFDVLERTPPLTAEGANLLGGFHAHSGGCLPEACSVGYFSAMLLLVMAVGIVLLASVLQGRLRRRFAQ